MKEAVSVDFWLGVVTCVVGAQIIVSTSDCENVSSAAGCFERLLEGILSRRSSSTSSSAVFDMGQVIRRGSDRGCGKNVFLSTFVDGAFSSKQQSACCTHSIFRPTWNLLADQSF